VCHSIVCLVSILSSDIFFIPNDDDDQDEQTWKIMKVPKNGTARF
jgi:hypothetical protein